MKQLRSPRRRLILILVLAGVALVLVAIRPLGGTRLTDVAALLRPVRSYRPSGPYVVPISDHTNIAPPKVVLGPRGLPLVLYPGIGYHSNPVTAAQYGLWAYGAYSRDGDARHRAIALHVAEWLVATQQRNGRWLYNFDFAFNGVAVHAPWASAMAQGQAMSLLERAFRITDDERYRRAAVLALRPLKRNVRDGGLTSCFLGDCHLPFFEEYPTAPPSYVLNGFMFTLFGLYDLASIAPRSDALALYAAGRRTLTAALPHYEVGGLASYDLTHLTVGGRPAIPSQLYEGIHVYLLRALDALRPNPRFSKYADEWAKNVSHAPP